MPVLGTGTVIFPWAVYSFIVGNYGLGIGLLVIYAVITVIRQIIEPKLVAGQVGLPPIATIIAIFFFGGKETIQELKNELEKFYPIEKQKQYSVLGIRVELNN